MSLATRLQKAKRTGPIIQLATRLDPAVLVERMEDEGMTFYHFSDGSKVGTKGRGRHFQIWNTTNQASPD